LAAGDSCSTLGVRSECPAGLVCQGTSGHLTCQSIGTLYVGKLGASCDAFGKLCELDLVCQSQSTNGTTGVCAELSAASSKCRRSVPSQCPLDQYCKDAKSTITARAAVGVDGVCAALPTDGKPCDADIGCAPGAVCLSDGLCHSYRSVEAACDDALECYSNTCTDGVCAAPLECIM
jgi:hypothetical protein